jgi:membrane-anchored protein YejM (alkaline phosphatase superfamily)
MRVELHWMKRDILRRWRLDTSVGIMGMLTLISGLLLFVVIGDGTAHIFRSFIPLVAGTRVGEVYWQSIGFGIKVSFIFLVFSASLTILFLLRFFERR